MDQIAQFQKFAAHLVKNGKYEPDFFELVRYFSLHAPDLPRFGCGKKTTEDIVRFGQHPQLAFQENSITKISTDTVSGKPFISENFFGLLGSNGPMPLAFTEFVLQRTRNHYDPTWQRFLDIINHRFLTLFYRAWEQSELTASHDRPDDDYIRNIACGISGIPPEVKHKGTGINAYLTYSAYTISGRASKVGLEQFLTACTKTTVKIHPFIPEKMPIAPEFRSHLGKKETCILGKNIQLGSHYISNTRSFNIIFGPLDYSAYCRIMPGSLTYKRFNHLISVHAIRPLHFDFTYRIRSDQMPDGQLSRGYALSRNFWLGRKKTNSPAEYSIRIEGTKLNTNIN